MDADKSIIATFYSCDPNDPESDDFYCHLPVLSTSGSALVDSSGGKIMLGQNTLAIPEGLLQTPVTFKLTVLPATASPHPLPSHITPLSDYIIISSDIPLSDKEAPPDTAPIGLISPIDPSLLTESAPYPELWTWDLELEDLTAQDADYDPQIHLAEAWIDGLWNDPAVPSQGLSVNEGFQWGAENITQVQNSCISSGGSWNGVYCQCGDGTHWSDSLGTCILNTTGTSGSGFSGFGPFTVS